MKPYTEKFKRQRKFLLVLPLLTLPFLSLAFWALGGGDGRLAQGSPKQPKGFNAQIPEAKITGGMADKMSLYDLAEQDSLAFSDARKRDPYAQDSGDIQLTGPEDMSAYGPSPGQSVFPGGEGLQTATDPNEQRVQEKLAALEKALNRAPDPVAETRDTGTFSPGTEGIDRLKAMLEAENQSSGAPDAELQQLDQMLGKLLDLQHPDRLNERLKQQSEKERGIVFPVDQAPDHRQAALLEAGSASGYPFDPARPALDLLASGRFYDLEDPAGKNAERKAIPAVIHETQTLVAGETVKLRLLEDIYVNGVRIPKGHFLWGTASIEGERLRITIQHIRFNNHILPVSLSVFDMDGIEGVRLPGAIGRDAAKSGADETVQSLQFMNMDPSLAAQAASAGIEAVKGLLSKKAKLIRVTVKAGYPVLLVDQKALQQTY